MGALLVLGATGRTGRAVVRPAAAARALAGSFEDAELAQAIVGAEVVLACLASPAGEAVCSRATRAVIAAARGRPLRCLVVSGAGVRLEGERKPLVLRAAAWVVRRREQAMMRDRDAELALLAGSGLRWTALRPPLLRGRAPRGRWTFSDGRPRRPPQAPDRPRRRDAGGRRPRRPRRTGPLRVLSRRDAPTCPRPRCAAAPGLAGAAPWPSPRTPSTARSPAASS